MSINLNPQSKILIIRLSSIGDIVLCSPIVRAIKLQKGCEIHFLTKSQYGELILPNPHIDKCIFFEDLDKLKTVLQNENYDLVVDLHCNMRTARIKSWLRCPSIKFYKANIEKWMMVNFKINYLPKVHIVDRYFDAVKLLDVFNDDEGLEVYSETKKNKHGLPLGYITIAFGTAHFTKTIPLELINNIIDKIDSHFVCIGGREHIDLARELYNNDRLTNLVGQTNLSESICIIQNGKLVLSGDTGMMHIAAAFKKPTISVWGSTIPEFGMVPYYGKYDISHHIVEKKELTCRPCAKIGKRACPRGHFDCMRQISAEELISKINVLIEGN